VWRQAADIQAIPYLSNLETFPVVRSCDAVLSVGATSILCMGAADNERVIFTLGCDQLLAEPASWCLPVNAIQ
jgi:hypothetical protein